MCTQIQLKKVSKEIVNNYKQVYGNDIIDIFLYGSYARGDSNEESDIDVVAIVNGNREDVQKKLKIMWDISADLGMEHDIIISPTVIPADEFEKYKNILPYYRNIVLEGKKIG